ncbi:trypsin-like serine protease [Actinoplanes sp. NPDC026623]|uniref:S1 family peptidase n=1 Tax=Actinoplanes sp. NPDC026623 TaxID=3155610 RepID=UPI00340FC39D
MSALAITWGAGPASAIAYGEDVPDGDYPFSVRLAMTGLPAAGGGTRDSSCSGALVAPAWVITAGHCFRDEDGTHVSRTVARRTTATVGRTDLDGGGGHEIEVVEVHQADGADVALARLADPVADVEPLRIATAAPRPGERVRLTGYGRTERTGEENAGRLQTGSFTVGAVGETLTEFSGRAPRRDTSACRHDSGGPYFRERSGGPELVAVVSTGPGCPHPGADLGARTDTLRGWITATVNGRSDPLDGLSATLGGLLVLLLVAPPAAYAVLRRQRHARHRS